MQFCVIGFEEDNRVFMNLFIFTCNYSVWRKLKRELNLACQEKEPCAFGLWRQCD